MNATTQKILRWRLLGTTLLALSCLVAMQMSVSVVVARAQVQADAGPLQTVLAGDEVMLFGGNSTGTITTYIWTQVAGPPVDLLGDSSDPPDPGIRYFTAPTPSDANGACLIFELSVSDGVITTDTCIVNVTIEGGNQPPIAHVGYDQDIYFDFMDPQPATIELNGNQSSDPDNDALSYQWTQVGGATVALNDSNSMIANFVHSASCGNYEKVYIFELLVTDSNGLKDESATVVIVHPPSCPVPMSQPFTTYYSSVQLSYAQTGLTQKVDSNGDPIDDTYLTEANSTFDLNAQASYEETTCHDEFGCNSTTIDVTDVKVRQVKGKAAKIKKLGGSPSNVEATAPQVGSDAETITFAVQAFDDLGRLARTTLSIEVSLPLNLPPVANAGADVFIESWEEGSTVIYGTANDEDSSDLQYKWVKVLNGDETVLADWQVVGPGDPGTDRAADLNLGDLVSSLIQGEHALRLYVKDDYDAVGSDDMILAISNTAPNASITSGAGTHQINIPITLGADVSDYDGDSLAYQWFKQLNGGEQVAIPDASGSVDTIVEGAPVALPEHDVTPSDVGIYDLILTVNDGHNDFSDSVTATVKNDALANLAPVANKGLLWPPNHLMETISIQVNAKTADGSQTIDLGELSVAEVISNEPEDGLGDGDQAPDWDNIVTDPTNGGQISLDLRRERSGTGNGRVYTIAIVATDEYGNAQQAYVTVKVQHDKRKAK
jgi:hypothetical protein